MVKHMMYVCMQCIYTSNNVLLLVRIRVPFYKLLEYNNNQGRP